MKHLLNEVREQAGLPPLDEGKKMPPVPPVPAAFKGRKITYKVGQVNKISGGRAVGGLFGVSRHVDGRRNTWALDPEYSHDEAKAWAKKANQQGGN